MNITRRDFMLGSVTLPCGMILIQEGDAQANPFVFWGIVRTLVWPALETLGAVVVDGAAAAAIDWFTDKAIEFTTAKAIATMRPGSQVYRMATAGKRIFTVYGTVKGMLTVYEAVKLIIAMDKKDGEPVVVWGSGKGRQPEASKAVDPYCAMNGMHLVLLANLRDEFLAELRKLQQVDPDRASTDQDLVQAVLVPTTGVNEKAISGRGQLVSFNSAAANVRILMSEAQIKGDRVSFRYDVSIKTLVDAPKGLGGKVIWTAENRHFTLGT